MADMFGRGFDSRQLHQSGRFVVINNTAAFFMPCNSHQCGDVAEKAVCFRGSTLLIFFGNNISLQEKTDFAVPACLY